MSEIKKIFVVGSGFMGTGISQVALTAGYEVTQYDISMDIVNRSHSNLDKNLTKLVSKGRLTEEDKAAALGRLSVCDQLSAAADADMVIEAAPENMDLKKDIFRQLSEFCRNDTIFASNTSSISITELSSVVKNPKRFVGMHFFSPVPLMKLLEVVKGLCTSEDTVKTTKAVGQKLGKTPITVKDSPAFTVNRMLVPMMNDAASLLEAGISSIEDIDTGARLGLNHPMGPLELMDFTGIDVAMAAMETIFRETGEPRFKPCQLLLDMRRMGWLGRKTGIGFYIYHEDGTRTPNPDL